MPEVQEPKVVPVLVVRRLEEPEPKVRMAVEDGRSACFLCS